MYGTHTATFTGKAIETVLRGISTFKTKVSKRSQIKIHLLKAQRFGLDMNAEISEALLWFRYEFSNLRSFGLDMNSQSSEALWVLMKC